MHIFALGWYTQHNVLDNTEFRTEIWEEGGGKESQRTMKARHDSSMPLSKSLLVMENLKQRPGSDSKNFLRQHGRKEKCVRGPLSAGERVFCSKITESPVESGCCTTPGIAE